MTAHTRARSNVISSAITNASAEQACLAGTTAANDNDRLLRLTEVLQRIPVSRSTWYQGIKMGRYPKGIQLGARAVAWRASDITKLMEIGAQP